MKRYAQLVFTISLLGVDAVMTCLAFVLAYLLRPREATPNQVIPPFTYYVGMMGLERDRARRRFLFLQTVPFESRHHAPGRIVFGRVGDFDQRHRRGWRSPPSSIAPRLIIRAR